MCIHLAPDQTHQLWSQWRSSLLLRKEDFVLGRKSWFFKVLKYVHGVGTLNMVILRDSSKASLRSFSALICLES